MLAHQENKLSAKLKVANDIHRWEVDKINNFP